MKTTIKNRLALISLLFVTCAGFSQQVYDNFEGKYFITYNLKKAGKLDSMAANPLKDKVNPSPKCAMYTRSKQRFDNIKMELKGKLTGVAQYATYEGIPPKIKMKIFTTAPVGTMVEIQLGKKSGMSYPEGTHSQYQALTTVTGKWEELEFKFSQIPPGSQTTASEIDQAILLFNPNTNGTELYYFDDITGPSIETATVATPVKPEKK
ncbi:MAG: hypothetical protein HYX39_07805 [Bacteroidetes bacterium]|nr:hypothetical protein [Bacteroidota bacterium]